eukprot:GHVR01124997.1.p1 GENE.GHVR01124997.1~~GHVR01124997.1.p1  ORF type:complete len:364 (-),score=101.65 GHVR01124997.1:27-1118(-)
MDIPIQRENTSKDSPPPHPIVIGKWKLGDQIGRGAFGEVFKAMHIDSGEFAAVKRVVLHNVNEDQLTNIIVEINLLKSLNHTNIVKYLESIRSEDHLNIVLEYVEAGSVRGLLDRFGYFQEPQAATYTKQVLEGLSYLHYQGVVHRDVKGANILTTKQGICKLADFGVARNLSECEKAFSVVGTPYWMAPEIISMDVISTSCDVWSVGCTVVEMVSALPPYWELSPMPALFRIVQDPMPPIPPGVSVALNDFLCRCFQKDPAMRSTAAQLLRHPWILGHKTRPAKETHTQSPVIPSTIPYTYTHTYTHTHNDELINTITPPQFSRGIFTEATHTHTHTQRSYIYRHKIHRYTYSSYTNNVCDS